MFAPSRSYRADTRFSPILFVVRWHIADNINVDGYSWMELLRRG